MIAGRIGDPHRFHSLAAIRAYSGLIPKLNQSGQTHHQHGLTKAGDQLLREALFTAADQARKTDPHLAAKYKRPMAIERHHDSAICHIAATLLTRIATCWRTGQHYMLCDTNGQPVTTKQGHHIVYTHHTIDKHTRIKAADTRQSQRRKNTTGRKQQNPPHTPTFRPHNTNPKTGLSD